MIAPPVFAIAAASPAVRAALGTAPVRVFPFGQAPEGVAYPYAVWQIVGGAPFVYLADLPEVDGFTTQIDIYARNGTDAERAAAALRDAIEPVADITRWGGETIDVDTGSNRFSFDVSWTTERSN